MHFSLDQPISITKKMVHRITGLPILNKEKTTKTLGWIELMKRNLFEWDGRGMKLNGVSNMEIKFNFHVISHKIYNSRSLDNFPCKDIDLAYKVVKNNLSFNLADLHHN